MSGKVMSFGISEASVVTVVSKRLKDLPARGVLSFEFQNTK